MIVFLHYLVAKPVQTLPSNRKTIVNPWLGVWQSRLCKIIITLI